MSTSSNILTQDSVPLCSFLLCGAFVPTSDQSSPQITQKMNNPLYDDSVNSIVLFLLTLPLEVCQLNKRHSRCRKHVICMQVCEDMQQVP